MSCYTKYAFWIAAWMQCVSMAAFGQLVVSGSNGCNCDGVVSYSWPGAEIIIADLTDYGNQFIQSLSGPSGTIQFQNLCPRLHSLHLSGLTSGDTTLFFSIEDIISPLPSFSHEIVCFSEAGQDESIELADIAGIPAGSYQWAVPGNYLVVNGDLNVYNMNSGVYQYTEEFSSCSKGSGFYVDFYNNSAGSETGSLLICESEVDSIELITLLGGTPASGGYWTFQGQEFNGVFYPATMEGGFSNRYYYNVYVPECGITNVAPATIIERVPPNPGYSLNTQNWYCQNHNSVNMFELLGGNPQRGGYWSYQSASPNSLVSGIDSVFVPGQSPAGIYEYGLIPLLPCVGTYKSSLTMSYFPDPSPGLDLDTVLCSSSDSLNLLAAIGAPTGIVGEFTDLSGWVVDSIYDPSDMIEVDLIYSINPFNCGARSVSIHIESLPNIDAGNDMEMNLCESELPLAVSSIQSSSADGGGFWHWSGGGLFTGDITNNYTDLELNYIIGNEGCGNDTSVYHVTVDQPLVFTPNVTSIELCEGGSPVNLLDALGSSNLYFTNSVNEILPIVVYPDSSVSSVIHAHLSSGNSCPNIDFPVSIEVQSSVISNAYNEYNFCVSALPLQLSDLIDPGLAALGSWIDEQNNAVSVADVQANDSANYTFQMYNSPLCGSDILEVKIISDPLLEAHANTVTTKCLSDSVFNLNTLVGFDDAGTWYYDNLPISNTLLSQSIVTNQQFEYRILSNNSCADAISTHQFEVRNLPIVNAGADASVCLGDTILLGGQSIPGYLYQWMPTQHLSIASQGSQAIFSSTAQSDTLVYKLTANDGFCSNTDSVSVELRNLPFITLDDSVQICKGASVMIEPTSDGSIQWQPAQEIDNEMSSSQTITLTADQIFRLTSTNGYGCTRIDSILITVASPPYFVFDAPSKSSCSPLEVFERIDSCDMVDAAFRWIIDDYDTLFGDFINTTIWESGVFDLIIEAYSPDGCKSDTVLSDLFEVFPNPVAEFDGYQEGASNLREEIIFSNESEGATHFEWRINGEHISQMTHLSFDFEGNAPGNYDVCLSATSLAGCSDSICHTVNLIVEQVVYAPTAFTPNGDGTNDGFKPIINGFSPEVYELIIVDKWGNIIFTSNSPDNYWMGEVNGGEYYCQNGVYNWMLKAKKFDNADVEIYKGSVMMIR